MAKRAKKRSIAATARSLANNFGRLAVDAQRLALMEMVRVYERATKAARKTAKKAKKAGKGKTARKARKAAKAKARRT
jgi:hypothetical protein